MARSHYRCALRILTLGVGILVGSSCAGETTSSSVSPEEPTVRRPVAKVTVLSRKKTLAGYPCQQCHQHTGGEGNAPVTSHSEIRVKHMEGGDNCQTCHDADNPEKLRLATGKTFGLDDVHELCRQCHSTQVADWEVGIHGKNVGNWLTDVQRFACTGCHNPHKPAYGSAIAVPPPPFPRFGIPKGAHE